MNVKLSHDVLGGHTWKKGAEAIKRAGLRRNPVVDVTLSEY